MQLKNNLDVFFNENVDVAESFMRGNGQYIIDEIKLFDGVTVEELDHYGGEDCGSEYYAVYKFTKDNESCMIRFDGYYQSHYGTDYQGHRFVEPKQKTITVWE